MSNNGNKKRFVNYFQKKKQGNSRKIQRIKPIKSCNNYHHQSYRLQYSIEHFYEIYQSIKQTLQFPNFFHQYLENNQIIFSNQLIQPEFLTNARTKCCDDAFINNSRKIESNSSQVSFEQVGEMQDLAWDLSSKKEQSKYIKAQVKINKQQRHQIQLMQKFDQKNIIFNQSEGRLNKEKSGNTTQNCKKVRAKKKPVIQSNNPFAHQKKNKVSQQIKSSQITEQKLKITNKEIQIQNPDQVFKEFEDKNLISGPFSEFTIGLNEDPKEGIWKYVKLNNDLSVRHGLNSYEMDQMLKDLSQLQQVGMGVGIEEGAFVSLRRFLREQFG